MRVKATKLGYYDLKRRYPGMEFDINPDEFSQSWMKKLDSSTKTPKKKVKEAEPEPEVAQDPELDLDVI